MLTKYKYIVNVSNIQKQRKVYWHEFVLITEQ